MSELPLLLRVLRDPAIAVGLDAAEWDLLLRQAMSANMSATLQVLLHDAGLLDRVAAPARMHLEWARAAGERHAQAVRYEVIQIGRALAGLGLPLILLKGGAYAMAGLRAGRGRMFSDIDILVPKVQLDDVEAALMLHGWATTIRDAYDQRYYREWMHELPPMEHLRRGNVIDVHHAILPETAAVRPDPAKLRAAAVALPGSEPAIPPLMSLAPRDMVLHSAVHMFSEGEFGHGLRNLFDIHRLLLEFGQQEDFWNGLPERARELELARPLFYALRYCVRLLGTPVPEAVLGNIAADGPRQPLRALMDVLFMHVLRPAHPSCGDTLTPIAQALLYIRGNWLRMPFFMLLRHLFHKAFLSPDGSQREEMLKPH